jgi:predicted MFS family arabinose efflux permease
MLEFLFLITFTTNISMHISGKLAGNPTVSGILIGIFSGAQIVMGLILGLVTKVTRKYTLPIAMLSFSVGGAFLICFPDSFVMLTIGAVFCGFSQGMFIPQAMCDVANAVKPVATTMASACFTCFMSFGQLISPTVLNTSSNIVYGNVTTSHAYLLSSIGMAISAGIIFMMKAGKKLER